MNHPKKTKRAFECRKCGHHRVDHVPEGECLKGECDCEKYS